MMAGPIRPQSAHNSRHAGPSGAAADSSARAVASTSLCSRAQSPSGSGWPSTAGACRQVRPCCSRRSFLITGDTAAIG